MKIGKMNFFFLGDIAKIVIKFMSLEDQLQYRKSLNQAILVPSIVENIPSFIKKKFLL